MNVEGTDRYFDDPPAAVRSMTEEIWNRHRVASVRERYAADVPVRTPSGITVGSDAVVATALATLAEFADHSRLSEDVIWAAVDDGFVASHRMFVTATHAADGVHGPASTTRVRFRVLVDLAVRDDRITDEWVVTDRGAVVEQLGVDARRFAAQQIEREGGPASAERPLTPDRDVVANYRGDGNDDEWGGRYTSLLGRIMEGDLAAVTDVYDPAVVLELPSGTTAHGRRDAESFWLGLRSSFPNAHFEIHHRLGRHDVRWAPRAAARWSLSGPHDGWGAYGAPTGAPVHVMGISHAEFGPDGIRREFVAVDETAIWKQILLHSA